MWPFNNDARKGLNFKFSLRNFRTEFIEDNVSVIINNLLRDVFELGIEQAKTKIPIYPKFVSFVSDKSKNEALSLFEVCFEAIRRGAFSFSFLEKTGAGFVEGELDWKNYQIFEAVNPYSIKEKKPLAKILEIPLSILYSVNRNLLVKDELFTNKFILFINGLRDYGTENSAAYIETFKKAISEDVKEIVDEKNNVWVFDSKDRIETPTMVDSNTQISVDFAYQEISRLTGIPLTRLVGKSPDGMNATGESDEENYRKTLEGILRGLVLPILTTVDPGFKVDHEIDTLQISQSLAAISSLDLISGLSEEQKSGIRAKILEKIGVKS